MRLILKTLRYLFVAAPEFVKRLGAFEEVEVGKDVVFECQWKSFPKPEFQWFKDETNITHDPRYQVKEGDNGVLTLYIQRVTKKDEGTYKCRVENCEGSNSTTGYMSVKGSHPASARTNHHRGRY